MNATPFYPCGIEQPEHRLLWCCARRNLNENVLAQITALLEGGVDWPTVLQLAQRHKLPAFLYLHLQSLDDALVPPSVKAEIQSKFIRQTKHNLIWLSELALLNQAMLAQGVELLAYKGPALSHLVYGKAIMRPCADLDLLVRPQDVPVAQRALLENGYITTQQHEANEEGRPLKATRKNGWARLLTYENSFIKPNGDCHVELHWALASRIYAFDLPTLDIWKRRVPSELNASIATLDSSDLLLALSLHGARNEWHCLEWVASVAELVSLENSKLDWELTLKNARRAKTQRILWLALLLAQDLAAVSGQTLQLPDSVKRRMQADKTAPALRDWVWQRLFLPTPEPEIKEGKVVRKKGGRSRQGRLFLLKARESWLSRYQYLSRDMASHYFMWIDASFQDADSQRVSLWKRPTFLLARLFKSVRKVLARA